MFTSKRQLLPIAQLAVMRVLWDAPVALSVRQITNKLQEQEKNDLIWNMSTVRTHLTRLTKRGYLAVAEKNRDRYYAVLIDEQTYLKQATSTFLSEHYKSSIFCMISTFADGRLSQDELQELRDIMSKLEE